MAETGIPRVSMARGRIPEHALSGVDEPTINLTLRGWKSMTVGANTLRYDSPKIPPDAAQQFNQDFAGSGALNGSDVSSSCSEDPP
ncbi:AraC family transcriptional regulator [Luteibacter yeojuensis]|uniref:AraC family transcriptional regulator n=1 Tax=Luteibacter yeojuensis TaxID=345309 RepID=A0A7X5QSK3_9GAMM|nr:AraC family transcriptional regulator [Luteibacter yeojuensis]NID14636.1 AraC family transcriptional regulator [Luteibacter yeojuensis]